jgi:hypothetical protein
MEGQGRDPKGRRVDIGLAMDEAGRFFIQGEPVTHRRTAEALSRGLFVDEAGTVCTRIGYEWSPVEVADTPLLVVGLVFEDGELPFLALSDGSAERLVPETLWLEGDRLYCRVRGNDLTARFVPAAAADLLVRVLEGDEVRPRARFGQLLVDLRQSKRSR